MRHLALPIATLFVICSTVSAETLVLNDGSVIRGNIRSLQDDVYTVATDSLGTLRIQKRDVRSIDISDEPPHQSPARPSSGGSAPDPEDLQNMQRRMMQSPDLFSMIRALQNDPEVQAVLADPEIMRALTSGDIATLMSHPKIIGLTNNASMREIIEEVQ